MKHWSQKAALFGITSAIAAYAGTSSAQEEIIVQERPNVEAIASGLFTLGIPYVASVVVAAQSDHPGDDQLNYPVAGPWLDLANRGACGGRGETNCNTETFNKAMLVGDGVLQGVGALEILGGFLFPEHHIIRLSATVDGVTVRPSRMGSGYGFSAAGRF